MLANNFIKDELPSNVMNAILTRKCLKTKTDLLMLHTFGTYKGNDVSTEITSTSIGSTDTDQIVNSSSMLTRFIQLN